MKVFICGKLGEIVKKIIELEDILKNNPTNTTILAELTAYNQVLAMWPVSDKRAVAQLVDILKLNIYKFRNAEKELREDAGRDASTMLALASYFKYLDYVKDNMHTLNGLGMWIGESPWLEVPDEVEQSDTAHPV
jgi:hypothetical protein